MTARLHGGCCAHSATPAMPRKRERLKERTQSIRRRRMEFSLPQVERAIRGRSLGEVSDLRIRGWSIDSRSVRNGDLFFAIRGERHDGHAFTKAALEQGAVAAVVSERVADAHGTLLEVPNTLAALQELAGWARLHWG